MRHSIFAVVLALAGGLLAVPARADLAPVDSCDAADVGKACENALANGKTDLPGTCQKAKCSRATPSGSMEYDCHLCKADSAEKKDDGDCSFSGHSERTALAAAPLLLLGLWYGRRRQHAKA